MTQYNKKAFITGAAKGLGRATAVALSTSGYKTILTDMDPVKLAETKKIIQDAGGSAVSYLLDVSDKKQIESVLMQAIKDEKKIDNINSHSFLIAETTLSHIFSEITSKFSISISLLLTNNTTLQELNNTFRQKDKPTNVLSFPASDLTSEELSNLLKGREKNFLGDIAISYDKISEEWSDYTDSFTSHFNHILIHGILHLCGYDHQNDAEANVMESIEQEIMNKIKT